MRSVHGLQRLLVIAAMFILMVSIVRAETAPVAVRIVKPEGVIGGEHVLFQVETTHDTDITVNAVTVTLREVQPEMPVQSVMIDGFTCEAQPEAHQPATWKRLVDTRGDFNTVHPLTRHRGIPTIPLFNGLYHCIATARYTNHDKVATVESSPVELTITNLNITKVECGQGDPYYAVNPIVLKNQEAVMPLSFTIQDLAEGHYYRWQLYLWSTASKKPDGEEVAILDGVTNKPGPVTVRWNGQGLSGKPFSSVTLNYDVRVVECTDPNHPDESAVDSQWYRAVGVELNDDGDCQEQEPIPFQILEHNNFVPVAVHMRILLDDGKMAFDLPITDIHNGQYLLPYPDFDAGDSDRMHIIFMGMTKTRAASRDHTDRPTYTRG